MKNENKELCKPRKTQENQGFLDHAFLMKNQFQREYERAQEYMRVINAIRIWMGSDIENNLPTSEFIFYKPAYPHISENFFKVADLLREYGVKFSAYSACVKDKDGEPVLFYKLIIRLREENE